MNLAMYYSKYSDILSKSICGEYDVVGGIFFMQVINAHLSVKPTISLTGA